MEKDTCTNCGAKTKYLWMAGGDYRDCDICWNCLDDDEREQIIREMERNAFIGFKTNKKKAK